MDIIGTQVGLTDREKVALLKGRLRQALRHPERTYPVNAREPCDTGRAYSDAAIDPGELLCALGRCSPRQRHILDLWLGRERLTQGEISRLLRVSVPTVKRDAADALRRMARMIWDD